MNILVDLKPALDGFAGIPQETRLLFRGLLSLPELNVTGLIQHGSATLHPALPPNDASLEVSERVIRMSRTIVSLDQSLKLGLRAKGLARVKRHFEPHCLLWNTLREKQLEITAFESTLFPDFVWRTFFSKTLDPRDMEPVISAKYRVLKEARKTMTLAGLRSLRHFQYPRFARLQTAGFDAFISQTPFPGRVAQNTKLIVRYHDAVPLLMPHTIENKAFHQASHFFALRENIRDGAWLACISEATRCDLLRIFPEAESRAVVIPNIVSPAYYRPTGAPTPVGQILASYSLVPSCFRPPSPEYLGFSEAPYLLMVSTIEPRKNHEVLLAAWLRLKNDGFKNLRLVLVGSLGWGCDSILERAQRWVERGEIVRLQSVPPRDLRELYRQADVTVCPSFAEGFDYSGVEAMASGGIVAASDIPVHREVFGDASAYFNPYCEEAAEAALRELLDAGSGELRNKMRIAGLIVSARYKQETILPKWREFCSKVGAASPEPVTFAKQG